LAFAGISVSSLCMGLGVLPALLTNVRADDIVVLLDS
jgi:hypothetical protein